MEIVNGTLSRVTDADIKNGIFSFPEGIEKIGDRAFEDCTSLQSISIPKSVEKIGYWAFLGCMNLQSITLAEGVKKIGDWTFWGCTSLHSITIPESVEKIGNSAFQDCTSLQSIIITEGVQTIDGWAFSGCTSLHSITIPEGVKTIGEYAFSGCTNLSYLYTSSTTAAGHQRIVDLLPVELLSRVVPHGLTKKLPDMIHKELHRIVQTPYTNPMGRIAKSGMPIPEDVLKEINGFLGEDNRFLSKARRQIDALPLPSNADKMSNYQQQVQAIVDEAIAHSKRGIAPPVMPEVLRHLKRLEDKASDLSSEGEEEAATTLRGLCAEVWALLYDNLDTNAFQEKCKQAIEQKYEVLGRHRGATRVFNPLQNFFKSDPAFLKTDTINLLDAFLETIEKEAPNQSPSESSC